MNEQTAGKTEWLTDETKIRDELKTLAIRRLSLEAENKAYRKIISENEETIRQIKNNEDGLAKLIPPPVEILPPGTPPIKRHKITEGDVKNFIYEAAKGDDDALITLAGVMLKAAKKAAKDKVKDKHPLLKDEKLSVLQNTAKLLGAERKRQDLKFNSPGQRK